MKNENRIRTHIVTLNHPLINRPFNMMSPNVRPLSPRILIVGLRITYPVAFRANNNRCTTASSSYAIVVDDIINHPNGETYVLI
jgi:hypothetical protein